MAGWTRKRTLENGRRQGANAGSRLRCERLEVRDLLTTLLVNFNAGGAGLNAVSAADYAVADTSVDINAPVNSVGAGGATGLQGTNGVLFDITDSGGSQFTTNKGVYEDEPILDSYLYVRDVSRTITVSGLEEIEAGQTVIVTLFGVGDANNQETDFNLYYNGGIVGDGTTEYGASYFDTFVALSFVKQDGVDEFAVEFENAGTGSNTGAFNGFSVTTTSVVRINAGGDAHVDSEGNLFLADQYFVGGRTFDTTQDIFIPGTGGTVDNDEDVDDILYQTERFDDQFGYEIPISNGFYTVHLHYAEIYHDGIGQRVFDVSIEGLLVEDNFDIFETRQNAFTPGNFSSLIQSYELVEVTDGALSLDFDSTGVGGVDNGKISAIEIIPADTPQLAVIPSDGFTSVLEGGDTDTYQISLTTAPTEDVIVTLDTGEEIDADITQLTFTPSNYDQPQTVVLSAVDDDEDEGTQTWLVTHSVTSLDPAYDGIATPSLVVVVLDDELVTVDFNMSTLASGITNPVTGAIGPDGRLYAATQSGEIRAYTLDGDNQVTDTQVISTIANLNEFTTILGIAFDPFEEVGVGEDPTIYVTRSSLYDGTEEYGSRVSTLSGVNFTTVTDIVTGLPVSGFDHGVNGIQFDGQGNLLIAIGGNTNTGVFDGVYGSQAPESPLTSAILRAPIHDPNYNGDIQYEFIDPSDPDLLSLAAEENDPNPDPNDQRYGEFVQVVDVPGEVEVDTFAVGLRNPYDLVYTTEGYVFSTDNGPNGIAADELNYIPEGAFLGHPSIPRGKLDPRQTLENAVYDVDVPSNEFYTAPLTALASSTNGIDEYRAETFGGQLRGQLIAQKWNGQVYFFQRTEDGQGLENTNVRTDVADGLDILTGPGGVIFGIDRNQNRITIAEPNDPTATETKAYDIFPWRAPAVGGNLFTIGGYEFGTLADTTVSIGGHEATLISVDSGKIVGVLPEVTGVTAQDVVVSSAGVISRIDDAFLPLNGTPKVPGDYDFNGVVDDDDYDVWRNSYGSMISLAADGNGDGIVNSADYSIWRDNYAPQPAAVQEALAVEPLEDETPATIALAVSPMDLDADETEESTKQRRRIRIAHADGRADMLLYAAEREENHDSQRRTQSELAARDEAFSESNHDDQLTLGRAQFRRGIRPSIRG